MSHITAAASRKIGIAGWEPCVLEAVTGGMLLTGGIPIFINGRKKWPARKNMERVILTSEEIAAEEHRYEAETSKCHKCYGTGMETIGWSAVTGMISRNCKRCGGHGGV